MLKSSKNKLNKAFKGSVFGMAVMLSLSSVPFAALPGALSGVGAAAQPTNTTTSVITLDGASKTAVKGEPYKIKTAVYHKDHSKIAQEKDSAQDNAVKIEVGGESGTIKTNITVKYKSHTSTENITKDTTPEDDIAGTFTPVMGGTYTITYSVTDEANGTYTYNYDIVCQAGQASFEFVENDKNILPSVYDLSIVEAEGYTGNKDIQLPMPKVLDGDGEQITIASGKEQVPVKFYKNKSEVPHGETDYVVIKVTGGAIAGQDINDGLEIAEDHTSAKLLYEKIKACGAANGYTITYTYYQGDTIVASTTRKFDVSEGYYKLTSGENAKNGYELYVDDFATSKPESATTGVAVNLPAVKAKTSANNSPSSESVNVYFSVKVLKRDANMAYTIEVPDTAIDTENNTFTPPEDGDYQITYTVTDFYGQHPKQTIRFWLNDVEDGLEPTVFIYNAKENDSLTQEDGVTQYTSVREDVKNYTVDRNMIVYAIGANDNAGEDGLKLSRLIKDVSGNTILTINESYYAKYNLIFNFTNGVQFKQDNFAVRDDIAASDESGILQYLKDNNYLIVTHTLKKNRTELFDFSDTKFAEVENDPDSPNFNLDEFKEALAEIGYAYVYSNSIESGAEKVFSNQTYSVYYVAEDKSGNIKEDDYVHVRVSVDSATDQLPPTVTFPTALQSVYRANDKITFAKPTFQDPNSTDELVKGVVAYRYLNNLKQAIQSDGTKSITIDVNEFSALKGDTRWFASQKKNTAEGFYFPELSASGQYTIDLSTRPDSAVYLEIFVYGVDDHGNMGFHQEFITITGANDTLAPTLTKITTPEQDVKFGESVKLPTLEFSDDYVNYMNFDIRVYHVSSGISMPNENAYTVSEDIIGKYTLYGGTFTASYPGTYRAVISVTDAGNNNIATFFDYSVEGKAGVEDPYLPTVSGISDKSEPLDIDEKYLLPTPIIKFTEGGSVSYAGYNREGDTKTAMYYDTVLDFSETNYVNKDKNFFSARAEGLYKIKYVIYLVKFNNEKTDVNRISEEGHLVFKYSGQDYYVIPSLTEGKLKYYTRSGELGAYKYEEKTVDTSMESAIKEAGIEIYEPTQNTIISLRVEDKTAPVLDIDDSAYSVAHKAEEEKIEIQKISAIENSEKGIDPNNSWVKLKIEKAIGSNPEQTVKLSEWENKRTVGNIFYEGGKQWLKFDKEGDEFKADGNYTLIYHVQDYSGKYTEKEYNFAVGDVKPPELDELPASFLNKAKESYRRGDTLTLRPEVLGLSDNSMVGLGEEEKEQVRQKLLDNVVITVKNTSLNNKDATKVEGSEFSWVLDEAGTYRITVYTRDSAGWSSIERTMDIVIGSSNTGDTKTVYQVVGTVLIVASVVILLGVIGYFIYSKFKLDKELKSSGKKLKKKNKK